MRVREETLQYPMMVGMCIQIKAKKEPAVPIQTEKNVKEKIHSQWLSQQIVRTILLGINSKQTNKKNKMLIQDSRIIILRTLEKVKMTQSRVRKITMGKVK
jgi:hypothetical protein